MGKKYFDTKKDTLESSILGVWQEAAKKNEDKLDPVNKDAVKKKFDDRKDKDIDNDGDVDSSDKFLHKRRKAVSKSIANEELDEKLVSARGKDIAQKMNKSKTMKAFAKKVAKMQTVTPDNLEKMLPDYVAGKDIYSMFEEGVEEFAVGEDVPAMEVGTDRYREYVSNLTPGEDDPEWVKARDFKVSSMKEALIKVWDLEEKKLDKESKVKYDEEDENLKPVKGSKTMTGGKVAKVEIQPKLKD